MKTDTPRRAEAADLPAALVVLFDEAFTALAEALGGLSAEALWSRPLPGRHSIGTIAMHVLQNLDFHAVQCQGGPATVPCEDRFDMWAHGPDEIAVMLPSGALPGPDEVLAQLQALRHAVAATMASMSAEDLAGPCDAAPEYFRRHDRTRLEACLRTLCHTHAHIRQVWALRAAAGLVGDDAWPLQHYA